MLKARRLDERILILQRQGRIATALSNRGQEAVALGAAYALRPSDWMVPYFRELAGYLWRGWRPEQLILYLAGYAEGMSIPDDARDLPLCIPVASQLPHAVGLAYASQYKGEDSVALVFLGDGATSHGDFHEAMNFAGVFQAPVVFCCANNQWAISVPVARQTRARTLARKALAYGVTGIQVDGNDLLAVYAATREAVERARTGGGPDVHRVHHLPARRPLHRGRSPPLPPGGRGAEWEGRDPLPRFRGYLEARGLLDAAAHDALDTRLGAGDPRLAGAGGSPDGGEAPGDLRPSRTAQRRASRTARGAGPRPDRRVERADLRSDTMPKLTMVKALNLALHQAMERDDDVLVLGQDVGVDGGVFRVTEGLLEKFGEQRVIDTPLAEGGIVGMAVGLALHGLKPVAEIQFSGFSFQAFHQIENHAARFQTRSQGRYRCPLVVRMPYGAGVRALEHHSESEEAHFAHVPGLKVVIPSGPRNARALLASAIADPGPVVFMEPKARYHALREDVPEEVEHLPLGQARVVREGRDVTVVAYGAMVTQAAGGGGHPRPRGRRPGRGHRSADDQPHGHRDDRAVGDEDRAGGGGARGRAHLRGRRGGHGPDRREGLPASRGARASGDRLRRAVQRIRPREGLVTGRAEDRPAPCATRSRFEPARELGPLPDPACHPAETGHSICLS